VGLRLACQQAAEIPLSAAAALNGLSGAVLHAEPMRTSTAWLLALTLSLSACAGSGTQLPQGDEAVDIDPADFTTEIDHPYWPMTPGTRWVYEETDAEGTTQQVEVTVTDETRTIMGVDARVVHDVVTEDGQTIEDTFDWYAQDSDGNVWYLGEDTKEFENGEVVSTAGSWEAGMDGAQPGIVMPADPRDGMAYRQEYYPGEAEDNGEVLSVEEFVEVPFGSFQDVVMTKDTTPLEPDVLEYKFYAPGVGPVLTVQVSGGFGLESLVEMGS
jgi:hypothetical protein